MFVDFCYFPVFVEQRFATCALALTARSERSLAVLASIRKVTAATGRRILEIIVIIAARRFATRRECDTPKSGDVAATRTRRKLPAA